MSKTNRQWLLAARPQGDVKVDDFSWREAPVPALEDGELLIRSVYLSLDPANRAWMNAADSYLPAMPLGSVMRGGAIGVVEETRNSSFPPGAIVQGFLGWQEYVVSTGAGLTVLPPLPIPLSAHMGLLGHIGLTAYYGLLDIGKPKAGETLVVSAAAGAVGSLVGQIGKIKGCRVVGIAGGAEKCRWIQNDLGFDAAIDYHSENVYESLRKHCPGGIDIYFDNVGGPILDAALALINLRGRIPLCGMISQYNASGPVPGPSNLVMVLVKRARMEGFIVTDYMAKAEPAAIDLITWYSQGKIKYRLDIVQGLENAPQALLKLFSGGNTGKLVVQVSPEPK
jgi:NADPH-dependent curcumin reductase CurA